jgi:hypothetical protein
MSDPKFKFKAGDHVYVADSTVSFLTPGEVYQLQENKVGALYIELPTGIWIIWIVQGWDGRLYTPDLVKFEHLPTTGMPAGISANHIWPNPPTLIGIDHGVMPESTINPDYNKPVHQADEGVDLDWEDYPCWSPDFYTRRNE